MVRQLKVSVFHVGLNHRTYELTDLVIHPEGNLSEMISPSRVIKQRGHWLVLHCVQRDLTLLARVYE